MGGFPALQIRPPESPVQQVAGVQQIQSQALQIQQEQQNIKDQHALTSAMSQWDGKDTNALPMLVLKAGGSGQAAMGMAKNTLAIKQQTSEIAKNDSITAQNNAETAIKFHDEVRGRLLNIAAIKDPTEQQTQWDKEVTAEEQKGNIQTGQISHTYPGNDQATSFANSFALGSKLQQEAQERQKLSLDAWKTSGGTLTNVITQEKIGGLSNIPVLNTGLQTRWQVLHPGEPLPDQFKLASNASPSDFERVDKLLEATEKGQATKAQQDTVNSIRAQTFEMQREKTDINPVVGVDPKSGRPVLVPMGQAQQMGIQNPMKADADMVNKAMAGRHWVNLASKEAPADAPPEEMGIMQLINKLDAEGKLGPLASRWNDFMANKFGEGDAEYKALSTKMSLSSTLLAQAHVGNRSGAQIIEHFEDLANQKKLDGPTLKAGFASELDYVRDRAMDPSPVNYSKMPSTKAAAKPSAAQAKNAPPISLLKEGVHTTFKNGETWTLQNGQAVQVKEQ
jgi:hypothetical protein